MSIRKTLLPFLLFSFHSLTAFEDLPGRTQELQLESAHADYNGKEIVLTGDVSLKHEIGEIFANQVTLIQASQKKKIQFAEIKMCDDVRLILTDGAQLSCSKAELNYLTLTGLFWSDGPDDCVTYSDYCYEKDHICIPFIVQSRKMKVNIAKEDSLHANLSYISDIRAEDQVKVSYHHNFIARADRGEYHRLNTSKKSKKTKEAIEGIIHLQANVEDGECEITNRNGDRIKADEIRIDTLARSLAFIYPVGKIHVAYENRPCEPIDFYADTMTWDEIKDLLTLREHIFLTEENFFNLNADEEVRVFQYSSEGKKQLHRIEADGKTVLKYFDAVNHAEHTLISYGNFVIDHDRLQMIIDAPQDSKGIVEAGKQIHFQDHLGAIYADHLILEYHLEERSLVPLKITLKGNVHIRNQFATNLEADSPLMQYAIADVAEYFPKTQEMTLSSYEDRRVLFLDKVNQIQVSASALNVKRDPQTKKESIKGKGDVRFTFIEQEMDLLRKRFNLQE